MKESHTYKILSTLSQKSIDSVQTGNGFSAIDKYLHTERQITNEVITKMDEIDKAGGGIILLVGSAGDGKSHLLSKIRLMSDWSSDSFYNDATASYSPRKTAIETLKEGLFDFSDTNLHTTSKKKIVAINLGKLNAFIDDPYVRENYSKIVDATNPLFDEDDSTPLLESERVKVVEFSNKQLYEINVYNDGLDSLSSSFLSSLLDKIVAEDELNPFYLAYKQDLEDGINERNPIILNYQLLRIPEIRKTIVMTVIEAILRFNLVITPREYLDFINSILVPKNLSDYNEETNFYNVLLPTLLYAGGKNTILAAISYLDPIKHSSTIHDQELSLLYTSNAIHENFFPKISVDIPSSLLIRVEQFYKNNGRNLGDTTKFLFRLKHVLDYHTESDMYCSFVETLKGVFRTDSATMMNVYELVNNTISRHYGSYYQKQDTIPIGIQGGRYKILAGLKMEAIEPDCFFDQSKPWEFYPRFTLRWEVNGNVVSLHMDYMLYEYLYELAKGKLAISYENEKNISFSCFLRTLAKFSDEAKALTIVKVGHTEMTLRKTFETLQLR